MVWRDRRTFFHLCCEDEDEKIKYKPWRTLWAFISVTLKNDQITEHLTVWRLVHPLSGKRFSPCSRVCSVQQGRNFMYREYTMTAIQRFVLQLSYMLINLYERLNQKCLSSRNFGHKNGERCRVESVLTEYLMSRLITQASGYQADPDHAAQLSHHGESFSFIHPQVTTGYLHQAGAEWWWVRSWDLKDENDSGSEGLNRLVQNDVLECSSVSFFHKPKRFSLQSEETNQSVFTFH